MVDRITKLLLSGLLSCTACSGAVAQGRLTARDIGLVINTADPYSVAVGEYYAKRRGLLPQQVLRVELPPRARLTAEEFEGLASRIESAFGFERRALALAWVQPYAVQCNGLTGALAMGFDAGLCQRTCAVSRASPFFAGNATPAGSRIAMQLAAPDVAAARRLIDRGVAADASLGRRGAPPVQASFIVTDDSARNVRARLYPPPGDAPRAGVAVRVGRADAVLATGAPQLLLQTGQEHLGALPRQRWVNGALADHLTSYGGQLDGEGGQSTALDWIASGVTASHGSASEPCSHWQKFPHPRVLLAQYLRGATAIEAYWRSVAWPQQSVFIGEPLAAPYAPTR